MHALEALDIQIADTSSALARLKSRRWRVARHKRVDVRARNRSIVNDIIAGLDRALVAEKHRVSYQVVANVLHQHGVTVRRLRSRNGDLALGVQQ